jgi:hypothetical protein
MDMATANKGPAVNRIYKDTLFRRLFGDERHKSNAVSLYNALGGSCDDPSELTFTTIEGVIYMGRKNDVSFLVDGELILWEHQSTVNPNMPLRGLIHLAQLYNKYLDLYGLSEYSSRRLVLPSPHYYVFYAGPANVEDRFELRLSQLFANGTNHACAEMVATVINVNEGHSPEVLDACEALAGYAHFVSLARAYSRTRSRSEAVDLAVKECMAEGVLTDFFTENRAEVVDLFLTEWDEEKYRDLLRREAEEDGYAAGEAEGRKEGLKQGLEQGLAQGLEQGLEQGLAQGLEEGRREGHEEGLNEGRKAVRDEYLRKAVSQVRSGRLTPEDAAVIFEFSQEEILALLDF